MEIFELRNIIENTKDEDIYSISEVLDEIISLMNDGKIKVIENDGNNWKLNEWVKKAILMFFKNSKSVMHYNFFGLSSFDKINLKFSEYSSDDFIENKIRVVSGAIVRRGSFIEKNVILMNCFVNIGAHIASGTMIDSFATIGSFAQISENCHVGANVVIGGVFEPLNAMPVIIEKNVFIGANSSITEGVLVKSGSVIAQNTHISSSTRIYDRQTGNYSFGIIPKNSVVVGGSYKSDDVISINCAVIIKKTDEKIISKTKTNEILREN